jgi:xanthine dehydrogenase accessory factor
MRSLLTSLQDFDPDKDYVVAIVIATEGSTYRKTGAMMLIDQSLKFWGLLSGGCLEGDIVVRSQKVFTQQNDQIIEYNMHDEADMLWGMGLGCDGEISILLKYLPANQQHFDFFSSLKRLNNGTSLHLLIDQKNNHQLRFERQSNSNTNSIRSDGLLSIPLKAPHHLLICGGSPDVPPVTVIANQIGWKTTVIDHRQDYADHNKFPIADHVKHIKRSTWKDFELQPFDSAIMMSHQFERDQSYLTRLIESPIAYLGLLGPTKRRDKLLVQCGTQFSEHEGRIFAPIGLDIGADSPETIALAIISEIQAVINHKQVGFCYRDPTR